MLSVFIMYFVIRKGIFPIIDFSLIIISCKNGKKVTRKIKLFLPVLKMFVSLQRNERGRKPLFLLVMIEKIKVLELVNSALEGSDKFLVNLKITPDNRIFIDIDGDNGVTIDDCIEVSRAVEGNLDREEEDFELNVSSAGADQPLKLTRQYRKNVGRELEVVTVDGEKAEGTLEDAGEDGIVLRTKGTKKQAPETLRYAYRDIKTARVAIKF